MRQVPRVLALAILGVALLLGAASSAETRLSIGYLELEGDARYAPRLTAARYPLHPWGRPFDGARVAIEETEFAASAGGVRLELRRAAARDEGGLLSALDRFLAEGTRFVLLDLPGESVGALARRTRGRALRLFNLSALDDGLRQEQCQPHLLHVAPSHSMLMDALVQFLVSRKWRDVLALKGPHPDDTAVHAAFERAAKRFGARLVDTRAFALGRDPRERARNNVALLTGGADYDVVFVADAGGEFARDVPYQVLKSRPVVGAAGLVADWWHWAWERHGAPQLNNRFTRLTNRPMTGYDWSAWMAVKAVAESALRTRSSEFRVLADHLQSDQLVLDGFKGSRLDFRPWDRQLRQPILLTTGNWVIERAPLAGFLHARNTMDTLGFDERDSRCKA